MNITDCYYLTRMTSVLNRLIIYALGTGLVTAILALIAGTFWIVLPDAFICAAILYIGVKMHVNSLLISLNSRRIMSQHLANGPMTTLGLSGSSFPSGGIRVDPSTTHRTDGNPIGPLTFMPTETTYTTHDIANDDIEMHKTAEPF
jgi:hypothetical protein